MMLPEHRAALNSLHKQRKHVRKLELDEQEQLLIDIQIRLAYETDVPIRLHLYSPEGNFSLSGNVKQIDRLAGKLRLQGADNQKESIPLSDIIGAEIDLLPEHL